MIPTSNFAILTTTLISSLLVACISQTSIPDAPEQESISSPSSSNTPVPPLSPAENSHTTPIPSPLPFTPYPQEVPVQIIPLDGSITSPDSEISGMAWYGDTLIILPQYPEKNPSNNGSPAAFAIQKDHILAYLQGSLTKPLTPQRVAFISSGISDQIPGYEGYEAIAIDGDRVFLTIEANHLGTMKGYLITGIIEPDLSQIRLEPTTLTQIPLQAQIFNSSYETILVSGDQVITIAEANGAEINPNAMAYAFDSSTLTHMEIDFPNIEYRLTDASAIDQNGVFWVTNVYFPIEFWFHVSSDPIADEFGQGSTHARNLSVERMIELHYIGGIVTLADSQPVQLELIADLNTRNWEALELLNDLGFLAMTDTYPETILGFIPFP